MHHPCGRVCAWQEHVHMHDMHDVCHMHMPHARATRTCHMHMPQGALLAEGVPEQLLQLLLQAEP